MCWFWWSLSFLWVGPKFLVACARESACGARSAPREAQRSRASEGLKTAISRLEISICVWKTPKSWWLMHLCAKFTVVHFSRASGAHKRFPNASKFLGGVTSVFCQKKNSAPQAQVRSLITTSGKVQHPSRGVSAHGCRSSA